MQKFTNLLFVSIILVFFTFCGKDENPTKPGDNKKENVLTSANIGLNGGTIKTDNIEIEIPSGAFQENSELKILESNEENSFGENLSSDLFVLDGLPLDIAKPINIKIKYSGTLSDSSFILVGTEGFVKSANESSTSFQLLSAKDFSGYLLATIPPLSGNALGKIASISSINGDKLSINLGAIVGYVSYVSQQGHFKINFPSSVLTQAYDLADYLEAAYSKFKSIGFSYSKRTKWPIEVNVKRLKSSVFGYSYNSVWGDNYGYMEFNFDKMDDKENLRVTAGHEFFHMVQSLYDPRNRFSKAKFFTPHLWLDEASAVWSEEYFSSNSNYVSPIFTDNSSEVLKGAKTGSVSDEAASYGYGMASFIKYLTKKHGNSALVKVYENIYNGKDAFSALSQVLNVDVGYNWNSYLKNLYTFELYKNDLFKSGSMLAIAKQKKQKFTIKSASDSVKIYKSSLTDLSATMFSIKNEFTKLNKNANLQFTCKGWNFQLYKVSSSESKFIKSGKDSLTLSNFKDITDKGYQIATVLYNDNFDAPYNKSEDYEMEIRVKAPRSIKWVDLAVVFTGTFLYNSPDTTITREVELGVGNFLWNRNSQVNGNTMIFTQDSTSAYSRKKTTFRITFEDINTLENIVGFTFEETENSVSNNVQTISSAAGINIPFSTEGYSNAGTRFLYEGDISQYLTKLSWSWKLTTTHNDVLTEKLLSYEPQGKIQIIIMYE